MAFGTQDDTDDVMNEINMTPLVDVMLVLLIIFIITVPVMKHAVNIELPRASSSPQDSKPQTIHLLVDAQGQYFWNEQPVAENDLEGRLQAEAARDQQPELHISGSPKPWRLRNARACARSASSWSRSRHEPLRQLQGATRPAG
jgi:biopolymer transport protein ExbD